MKFWIQVSQQYCYVFTFFKMFKYDLVNCKQRKKQICVQFQLNSLYCPHYPMCHCSNLYHINDNNYNNHCFSHKYSLVLYNGHLQTTTVLFTRNFTQHWLNSYYSLSSALSCLFIVQPALPFAKFSLNFFF